jgi:class 3 adenylate cyclase
VPECTKCGHGNAAGARFCNSCGAALSVGESTERVLKTVTVLFSDVVGSTELGDRLDPEAITRVFGEYFSEMRPLIERHGGTVAKFMGDAVMAVFGVPTLHEDDALRAVRAALDMRQALDGLNSRLEQSHGFRLETRTGIHTGAVAGSGVVPDVDFVGGDTTNVAARLQSAADGGTILLSGATYRLVKDAIEAELLPPLELAGKTAPVTAFRLSAIRQDAEAVPRRLDAPIVGRADEFARLGREYARAVEEGRCRLVTVLGAAGVGKSRLAREFVDVHATDARVLVGRCLPYGDGITYWPVAEMVRFATGIERSDARDAALTKLAAVCRGAEEERALAERLAELLGLGEAHADSAEIFLAVRRLFEHLAAQRPVIAAFDDVQWAEATLLDMTEYVATHARGPLVVLCLGRSELLEARPNWGGLRGATTLRLQPLRASESEQLVSEIVGAQVEPRVAAQIAAATDGNPLFVEQLLSMLIDEGRVQREHDRLVAVGTLDTLEMPSTIQAVLAARLETLEPDERQALGQASVIGQTFDLPALEPPGAHRPRGASGPRRRP